MPRVDDEERGWRKAGDGQRAAGGGRRATGDGRRAADGGRRAAGGGDGDEREIFFSETTFWCQRAHRGPRLYLYDK